MLTLEALLLVNYTVFVCVYLREVTEEMWNDPDVRQDDAGYSES